MNLETDNICLICLDQLYSHEIINSINNDSECNNKCNNKCNINNKCNNESESNIDCERNIKSKHKSKKIKGYKNKKYYKHNLLNKKNDDTIISNFYNLGKNDKNVKILKCKHIFHYECFINWYMVSNTCPCCRKIIPYYFTIYFKKQIFKKRYLIRIEDSQIIIFKINKKFSKKLKKFNNTIELDLNSIDKSIYNCNVYKIIYFYNINKISIIDNKKIKIVNKDKKNIIFFTDYEIKTVTKIIANSVNNFFLNNN